MTDLLEPAPSEGLHPALKDFLAGGFAGAAGVAAGQPLDTVRIRLQQPGHVFSGGLACWRAVVAHEGPRALFRGVTYPAASVAFQNAIVFQSYGFASRFILGRDLEVDNATPATYGQTFAAGMAAGLVQSFIITPVDLLKIRQQLQTVLPGSPAYVGPLSLLQQVLRAEGIQGLYRGLGMTLVRDIPSHGVYFCMYDWVREQLEPGCRQRGTQSHTAAMVAGGVAGSSSWLSIYPLDVIKSRLQAHSAADSRYSGWRQCVVHSYRTEGVSAFTRGLGTTLSRAFVVNGVIFATFELCMQTL